MWLVHTYLGGDNISCWYSAWDWTKHSIIVSCWAGLMTAAKLQWDVSGSNSRKNSGKFFFWCLRHALTSRDRFTWWLRLDMQKQPWSPFQISKASRRHYYIHFLMPVLLLILVWLSPLLTVPAPNCSHLSTQQLAQRGPTCSGSLSTVATPCIAAVALWTEAEFREERVLRRTIRIDKYNRSCAQVSDCVRKTLLPRHLGFLLVEQRRLLKKLHFQCWKDTLLIFMEFWMLNPSEQGTRAYSLI